VIAVEVDDAGLEVLSDVPTGAGRFRGACGAEEAYVPAGIDERASRCLVVA
jgi:hypothetical protein